MKIHENCPRECFISCKVYIGYTMQHIQFYYMATCHTCMVWVTCILYTVDPSYITVHLYDILVINIHPCMTSQATKLSLSYFDMLHKNSIVKELQAFGYHLYINTVAQP